MRADLDYLNHGSFGATPRVVLDCQRQWIERLEQDPIEFLAPERSLLPKLDAVRQLVAGLVNAPHQDLAFVRNSTEGVNAVMRSFPFKPGDVVMVTSHGYNACNNAAQFAADRAGAAVVTVQLPFPISSSDQIVDAICEQWHPRTRLLLVDHVTSPTALVFPVQRLVKLAHERQARVLVDGAHAPGMIPIDLSLLDADYYTANHHKWLCGPKSSAFLYVKPELQPEVRPTVISHGTNRPAFGDTTFLAEFNWMGTYDPSPLLSLPTAIEFLSNLWPPGLSGLMQRNHELVLAGRQCLSDAFPIAIETVPAELLGSMATIPIAACGQLSPNEAQDLHDRLYRDYRIELPVLVLDNGLPCVRISAQAYNDLSQYQRLAAAISQLLACSSR